MTTSIDATRDVGKTSDRSVTMVPTCAPRKTELQGITAEAGEPSLGHALDAARGRAGPLPTLMRRVRSARLRDEHSMEARAGCSRTGAPEEPAWGRDLDHEGASRDRQAAQELSHALSVLLSGVAESEREAQVQAFGIVSVRRKAVIEPACVRRELQLVRIQHVQPAQHGDRQGDPCQDDRDANAIATQCRRAEEGCGQRSGSEKRAGALAQLVDLPLLLLKRLLRLLVAQLGEGERGTCSEA